MVRPFLIVVAALFATAALAAPVPKEGLEAKYKALEEQWEQLLDYDREKMALAAFRLGRNQELVPFLAAKLKPVSITEERCKQWLKELGDKDEKVWKPAYILLKDNSPLLVLDFADIWQAIPADGPGRKRYTILNFLDDTADNVGQYEWKFSDDTKLVITGNGYQVRMKKSQNAPPDTADGGWHVRTDRTNIYSRNWQRTQLAIGMLETIGTAEAIKVVEQLAAGHEEAGPTKVAKAALARQKKK